MPPYKRNYEFISFFIILAILRWFIEPTHIEQVQRNYRKIRLFDLIITIITGMLALSDSQIHAMFH